MSAIQPTTRSIGEALIGTHNSLGLIRLVLASVVLVDHAFPLGGFGTGPVEALTNNQALLGILAVGGFLRSADTSSPKAKCRATSCNSYRRQALRILRAYWLLLLVTALRVGPALWITYGRDIGEYFTGAGGPARYFLSNFTLTIGLYGLCDLPATTTAYGVLVGRVAFNGSIWTLIFEWNCYLNIVVLIAFGVLRNARVMPVLATFFLLTQVVPLVDSEAISHILPRMADPYTISLGFTFLAGSIIVDYSR